MKALSLRSPSPDRPLDMQPWVKLKKPLIAEQCGNRAAR